MRADVNERARSASGKCHIVCTSVRDCLHSDTIQLLIVLQHVKMMYNVLTYDVIHVILIMNTNEVFNVIKQTAISYEFMYINTD